MNYNENGIIDTLSDMKIRSTWMFGPFHLKQKQMPPTCSLCCPIKTGVIILPTQTMHCYKGKSFKLTIHL